MLAIVSITTIIREPLNYDKVEKLKALFAHLLDFLCESKFNTPYILMNSLLYKLRKILVVIYLKILQKEF